ncbi:type III-B CRISPR module-associated Cmr3 family protein [Haliscomenobacter hydrossis]|uniref:CRISPR-associated protein, Cmr3 n=1 Tax=Haliscomenobacter hydrossis (strain ATCC 27775 / DSM 1100 / LMG 10767 / O) TaxID=760192 RepID=F4L835_HALH1|nr:type III-B CRISPR module-associated Cmr3 family protein [Haliscomenobacter hydrossis]AEE54543.1 CRISPR-associated protein, Cmr3 [Haliscomenobacter hydrossis DSM 1100]
MNPSIPKTQYFLVRLTPCDAFFFGTNTYAELANPATYYTHSARFPQQTSLLGLVRYQLLLQAGLISRGDATLSQAHAAEALIGPGSFPAEGQNYGAIESISPAFLLQGERNIPYLLRSHEFTQMLHSDEDGPSRKEVFRRMANVNDKAYSLLDEAKPGSAYSLSPYSAKNEFVPLLISTGGPAFSLDEVLIPQHRDHNNKSLQGTNLDQGRFKSLSFRLKPGFGFGFYLALANGQTLQNDFITLGGRRSRFKMEVFPQDNPPEPFEPLQDLGARKGSRYLLLSDAYMDANYLSLCQTVIGQVVQFRHHQTRTNRTATNYFALPSFSEIKYLLGRGAILYLNKDTEPRALCAQYEDYHKIGYNHFLPID